MPVWNRAHNDVFLEVREDRLVVNYNLPHDSVMEATRHTLFIAVHRFPIVPLNVSKLVSMRSWL